MENIDEELAATAPTSERVAAAHAASQQCKSRYAKIHAQLRTRTEHYQKAENKFAARKAALDAETSRVRKCRKEVAKHEGEVARLLRTSQARSAGGSTPPGAGGNTAPVTPPIGGTSWIVHGGNLKVLRSPEAAPELRGHGLSAGRGRHQPVGYEVQRGRDS